MYRNLHVIAMGCLVLVGIFLLAFNGRARTRADFVWNNTTEPQTLDPNRMSAQPEGAIAMALFEGLTVYHPGDLKPVPGVARSIRQEGRTYIFDLREDAFWIRRGEILRAAGGEPRRVTAEDVAWSWRRHFLPEVGSEYSHLLHAVRGAREFEREMADQWARTVEGFRAARGRPPTGPEDLDPQGRLELERFRRQRWDDLVGIRAPSASRLEVELVTPVPYFLHLTSFYPLLPVCREAVEEHGERWVLPENMVSNGPYWLEEWQFNAYLRLRKNRHYWETGAYALRRIAELAAQAEPSAIEARELDLLRRYGSFGERGLEVLEAFAVEEINTSLNLYLNGDVDYIREVPQEVARELVAESRRPGTSFAHLQHAPSLTLYFYALNNSLDAFQGEAGRKLRRALSLCVDRRSITEDITRSFQIPALRFVPPGIEGYPEAPLIGSGDFETDVREARRLVEEVRREKGTVPRLRILYNTHENHEKIAAAVQSGWRSHLGIDVDLSNQEWGVFLDSRRSGNFDIARASWIADYPDALSFLGLYASTSQNNDTGYRSALFDRIVLEACADPRAFLEDRARRGGLLQAIEASEHFQAIRARARAGGPGLWDALGAALAAFDGAPEAQRPGRALQARLLLFEVAEEILVQDMPAIPIYVYTSTQLRPPELEGLELNALDYHPPKFFRWKDGRRPTGSRLARFPRFSGRESPAEGARIEARR